MTTQPDFASILVIKPRSKRNYSHRISSGPGRIRQSFRTIRSGRSLRYKLSMASSIDDSLYSDEQRPLNPYARMFMILWLLGALVAIVVQYNPL